MEETKVTIGTGDVTAEVTMNQLSDYVGEQLILEGDKNRRGLAYLGALSLECYDEPNYDARRAIVEFCENSSHLGLTADEVAAIRAILQ